MKKIGASYTIILILFTGDLFASYTDYYDRYLFSLGVKKGLVIKDGDSWAGHLFFKGELGYGVDDNKVVGLNISFDKNIERLYLNPEFVLLLNEFSSIKFFITAGVDFGFLNNFESAFVTSEGLIFDLFNYLSISLGVDNRFNFYSSFYIETQGLLKFIIRI